MEGILLELGGCGEGTLVGAAFVDPGVAVASVEAGPEI